MKNIIIAIVGVLVVASCASEALPLASQVSADAESLTFTYNATESQSFNVTADGDWVISVPSWAKVEPTSGTGNALVTVSMKEKNVITSNVLACDRTKFESDYKLDEGATWAETGESGAVLPENKTLADSMYFSISHLNSYRSADITIEGNGVTATVGLTQEGDANWVSSVQKIKIGSFIALEDDPATWYELTGTITSITNTNYGNFYMQDETGSVYVYGIESSKGAGDRYVLTDMGINVGDEITIIAYKGSYNDIMEAMGAYYVSHESRPLLTLESATKELENVSGTFDVAIPYTGATIGIDLSSTDSWLTFNSQSTVTTETGTNAVFNFSVPINENDDRSTTVGFYSVSADGAIRNDVTLTVTQKGGFSVTYKEVSAVTSGKTYVIIADGKYAAKAVSESSTYGYLYPESVTVSGSEASFYNPVCEFVITSVEGGYTIKDCYGRYLYQTGTYGNFSVSTSPSEGHVWSITSEEDSYMTITNLKVQKTIAYSTSYSSYGIYAAVGSNLLPKLYEKVE